jgi:hypothetical protein
MVKLQVTLRYKGRNPLAYYYHFCIIITIVIDIFKSKSTVYFQVATDGSL